MGMKTPEMIESDLGERIKRYRLVKNLDQKTLAERAGVSVRALRNLEGGAGSTVHTLVRVMRALGRESWFDTIAPVATIDPLTAVRGPELRQRASHNALSRRSSP